MAKSKLRKMLGALDWDCIISLMRLIETQSKKTLANWCLDYAEEYLLPIYQKHYPGDNRPKLALDASRDWFEGKVKLPEVKNLILNECHSAAREAEGNPAAQAAARACGQASACFHTPTHSLGIAWYGSAAIAYDRAGVEATQEIYDCIAKEEITKMEAALRSIAIENEPNPAKIKWNC
jgi:hypothetical protein